MSKTPAIKEMKPRQIKWELLTAPKWLTLPLQPPGWVNANVLGACPNPTIHITWEDVLAATPGPDAWYRVRIDKLSRNDYSLIMNNEITQLASLGPNYIYPAECGFIYAIDVVAKKGSQESSPSPKKIIDIPSI